MGLAMHRTAHPHAFKSRYYLEREGWDAAVKVDWDRGRNPITLRALRALRAYLDGRRVAVTRAEVYRTAKGWHLRAWTSRPLGPYETLRAQSAAEDDPVRQAFNAARVRRREEFWNVLWNEKHHNGRLIYREETDPEWTSKARRILSAP